MGHPSVRLRKVGFRLHESVEVPILDMGSQSSHPLFAKCAKRRMGHTALVIGCTSGAEARVILMGLNGTSELVPFP